VPQGEYLQYGGQAVVEGVMMRSPRYFAIACRAPNGQIVLQTEALERTWIGRQKWLKWPFLRGSLALLDTIALGIRSMRFAGNVQLDPRYQAEPVPGAPVEKLPSKSVQEAAILGTFVLSLGLALFLFNYLPNLVSESLRNFGANGTTINFATEVLKILIFLGYLYGIGQLKDIQEVFKFHGAEHKAINAMEDGQPVDRLHALAQTRLHPRCGTSFAIVVLLVSMVIFTFVPRYPFGAPTTYLQDASVRFLVELCLLPFISGIAYEVIRWAGRQKNTQLVNTLLWPGLMSQYLTTREPEGEHLDVAVTALRAVIRAEETGELVTDPRDLVVGNETHHPLPDSADLSGRNNGVVGDTDHAEPLAGPSPNVPT
jgi:uncharacterized protein YqhQ